MKIMCGCRPAKGVNPSVFNIEYGGPVQPSSSNMTDISSTSLVLIYFCFPPFSSRVQLLAESAEKNSLTWIVGVCIFINENFPPDNLIPPKDSF